MRTVNLSEVSKGLKGDEKEEVLAQDLTAVRTTVQLTVSRFLFPRSISHLFVCLALCPTVCSA